MDRYAFLKQLASNYTAHPDTIAADTSFSSLGMDSYDIVDLMLKVEEHFGITVNDDDLLSLNSLQDVEELIEQCMKEDNNNHA